MCMWSELGWGSHVSTSPIDQAFQSAFNGLHFFHASRFQSYGSERGGYFIRCQVEIHILFQPVIRDIHIIIFYCFQSDRKVNKIFL